MAAAFASLSIAAVAADEPPKAKFAREMQKKRAAAKPSPAAKPVKAAKPVHAVKPVHAAKPVPAAMAAKKGLRKPRVPGKN